MPRIPDTEIERLKNEVSVERLVEASGVELKKAGKDMLGRCPFHDDAEASLVVTAAKNLWHCFGCQIGGGPIDWVIKSRGVSFRHAVELLKADPSLAAGQAGTKRTTVRSLPPPVAFDADDRALVNQTIDYYHQRLQATSEAVAYLKARGLAHPELVATFKLGVADRTLGLRLPEKTRKAGADIRARLQKVGLIRESGHEHFNGSLVIPVFDEGGNVVEVYGRKLLDNLRPGTPKHLYLPGPHAGVFNRAALTASREIILAESLIDALTFWCAGYRNVTAAYGVEGFTDELLAAFKAHGTTRVLIAYDRDDAGERAAEKLAPRLMAEGIECWRVQFPKGMDANEYAQKMQPADKALGLLIRKALWMGNGEAPQAARGTAPERQASTDLEVTVCDLKTGAELKVVANGGHLPGPPSLAAKEETAEPAPDPIAAPTLASPQPVAPSADVPVEQTDTDLVLVYGERRYRVRGWKKPLNPEALKVNLLASKAERFHVDSFDLYNAKARAAFVKQAGIELGEAEDVLKHDLGRVLLKLEEVQTEALKAAMTKDDKRPRLSEAEEAEALALLRDPRLLDRILADFAACGVVGEETNKLVGYLAAVSRQLDRPLAVIIQSSSAAGKSSLMDAVLALMPDEACVRYSAMTGQSLFYMGETNLKHKILAIAEEEGVAQAGYALKLLQSDGQVTIASTGKDPTSGLLVTHEYRVEGPVMLFLTTTAIDIDEELLNRCLVLTVNESREQTRAIHVLQRSRQTLEGLLADEGRDDIVRLHRNAQRLLQPLAVVNPYADRLTFLDDKTRTRRDHMKYLSLIRAIALLHQCQREVKTVQRKGKAVRYIEVTPADITVANRLAHEVLGRTLDELPPQTRRLLTALHAWVSDECQRLVIKRADFRFTRRQVRELTGWGDTQLKVHLGRLAELEYLLVHRVLRGGGFEYELIYDAEGDAGGRFLMGLADLEDIGRDYDAKRSGANEARSAPGRGAVGGVSAGGRGGLIGRNASNGADLHDIDEADAQDARSEIRTRAPSYPQPSSLAASTAAA
ncbi:MAG: toprim domain-containing protein [Burkholderiales bacterium]|nr:toprim domain-containing protein [Burkholderiales bacterium]